MKHTITAKFIAFLLAACSLVAVLVSGGYALMLERYNLYDITPEEKLEQWYSEAGYPVAWRAAAEAAAMGPGECSKALAEQLFGFDNSLNEEHYYITVWQGDSIVHSISKPIDGGFTCEYTFTPQYPKVVNIYPAYSPTDPPTNPTEQPAENPTTPIPMIPIPGLEPVRVEKVDVWEDLQKLIYELNYYDDGPTYTVSVTMAPAALKDTFHSNLITLYPYRYTLVWLPAFALILTAAAVVYLLSAAGRTKDGTIRLGGLNRLPLDLYLAIVCAVGYLPLLVGIHIYGNNNSLSFLTASLLVLCGIILCLLILAVVFALAAQVKLGKGYWWRHTVLGMCLRAIVRGILALIRMIGVLWQWLLLTALMLAATVLSLLAAVQNYQNLSSWMAVLFSLCCISCLVMACYGGYCFGTILIGARKMSKGQLEHKIPTQNLRGNFRDCAEQMNALSETTMQAVQNQVRAERMKTELITNVSHDIKTPLTSIINFVDLLEKPHTPEDGKKYLEVLSRQSQQLKKLIEDLLELSKASTGNMSATIITLDAAETVNQALGEFADKLEAARLTPVFHAPEQPIHIAADGRLTWRVLSNLLSNAVKYATPGTRVYVDLVQAEDKVYLSIKNISREELRVSAEELMERFVRGDTSRNKEGSGLGLNIAKSLMEVQHGNLELLLDGDLFKVTLIFPSAAER